MSLQVWLPLNGSLNNQGLSNIIVTNNGATINNNGKIGKCYLFNGSTNYLQTNYNFYNSQYSVCAWFYSTSSSATQTICCERTAVGSGFSIFLINGKIRIDPGGNSLQWTTNYTYPINTWVHLGITYDGTKISYYINGQYQESANYAIASNYWTNILSIGASQANGSSYGNYLNGRINDVRVYNHCLSQKEVEEISKGLVLHLKLDDINIDNATNLVTSLTAGGQTTITNNIVTTSGANADTYFTINLSENIVAGTSYIISCDAEIPDGKQWTFPLGWQANTGLSFQIYNGHNIFPFTANEGSWGTNRLFMDDGGSPNNARSSGKSTKIFNFKLIKADSSKIIYDSSGYQHNGEVLNTFTFDNTSPRYNQCYHISATNQKIHISNFITSGFGNSYSFAWWGKRNSNSPMFWGFSDGIRLNGMYIGNLWNTGDSSNNPLYNIGTTTQVAVPSVDVWHHYVMTGNGTKCYVYLDGELWAEAKTYKAISGTSIYINGWDSGTSYCSDNTSISDFRIYATALTAAQVKELYDTSATIDNLGNVYTRELVEI